MSLKRFHDTLYHDHTYSFLIGGNKAMTAQFLCMGKGIFRPHRIENPSTDTDQQNIGLNEKLKNCSVFTVLIRV